MVALSAVEAFLAGGAEEMEEVAESLSARVANWFTASSRLSWADFLRGCLFRVEGGMVRSERRVKEINTKRMYCS